MVFDRPSKQPSPRNVWRFRGIIVLIVSRSSSPEVCDVHSRSLEASRSCVGTAERDDILWFRCIFGASRKGPLRARCDYHAASSHESWCCAGGASSQSLAQSDSDSESVTPRRSLAAHSFAYSFRSRPRATTLPNIFSSFCFSMTSAGERP